MNMTEIPMSKLIPFLLLAALPCVADGLADLRGTLARLQGGETKESSGSGMGFSNTSKKVTALTFF